MARYYRELLILYCIHETLTIDCITVFDTPKDFVII